LIETFVAKWREGYAMVYGQRIGRRADGTIRRGLTKVFYRLFRAFGETPCPRAPGTSGCWIGGRWTRCGPWGSRARFSKGLYAWIGFSSLGVPFEVAERAQGMSEFELSQAVPLRLRRHRVVLHAAA
jgi:hypothetical protein